FARPSELPAYLISTGTLDGVVDDSHRLRMTARFEIHVFASQPAVPVHLPLGLVNLGGADACLVDGRPHSVLAGPEGRGLVVDLAGPSPLPATPALPEQETGESGSFPDRTVEGTAVDSVGVRTSIIELHLYPPVDSVRPELLTSTVGVPPGCQTRAM